MVKDKTVAEELVDALCALGVRYVFGVPSGGWLDYLEALRKTDGIEFILSEAYATQPIVIEFGSFT